MRLERVVECSASNYTPHENWNADAKLRQGHWYDASTQFAVKHLPDGDGRSCLVIGSPLFEAQALIDRGWDVTYLDIRVPPVHFRKFIQCDASNMTLESESFDALSSACVLTHVGLGRYGDPLVEHGDEKALAEMARVLKRGGRATITFGAVIDAPCMIRMGTTHRVYTLAEAERMLQAAGLSLVDLAVWNTAEKKWRSGEKPTSDLGRFDYLSTFVKKV